MSPYKSEHTPTDFELHSHSPFPHIDFSTLISKEQSTFGRATNSLEHSMPPPPLPSHIQQRHVAWGSPDLANDPFVDSKPTLPKVVDVPSIECNYADGDNALVPSFAKPKSSFLDKSFLSLLPLQTRWEESLQRPTSQKGGRSNNLDLTRLGEVGEDSTLPVSTNVDSVRTTRSFAPNSQTVFSLPATGHSLSKSSAVDSNGRKLPSADTVIRSLEDDDPCRQDGLARPQIRHDLELGRKEQPASFEALEVLGELHTNRLSFDSPQAPNRGIERHNIGSTPSKLAGEKRKRGAGSYTRPRRSASVNSTPSSTRKKGKVGDGIENRPLGTQ